MKQAARQTRTHIGELLARHGINPRHDLGQNFLIDLNLVEFLVGQAELEQRRRRARGRFGDRRAHRVSGRAGGGGDRRRSRSADAAVDGRGRRRVLQRDDRGVRRPQEQEPFFATRPRGARRGGCRFARSGSSSSPTCPTAWPLRSSRTSSPAITCGSGWSSPSSSNWPSGWRRTRRRRTTAVCRCGSPSQCRIELLKRLPADVFWPRPKVESAMIRIAPDAGRRQAIRDRAFLHDFLRGVFQQRRKLLRNVLVSYYRDELDRTQIDGVLKSQNLGERARAEELSPAVLVNLANALLEVIQQTRGAER